MKKSIYLFITALSICSVYTAQASDKEASMRSFYEQKLASQEDCATPILIKKVSRNIFHIAKNNYYEGWREPLVSQYMIAQVVLARQKDILFPHTVKKVIYQRNAFSWTITRRKRKYPSAYFHKQMWEQARQAALMTQKSGLTLSGSWQCVRFYKRTDNKAVSERSKEWFKENLYPVGSVGAHTYYCYKDAIRQREEARVHRARAKRKKRRFRQKYKKRYARRKTKHTYRLSRATRTWRRNRRARIRKRYKRRLRRQKHRSRHARRRHKQRRYSRLSRRRR